MKIIHKIASIFLIILISIAFSGCSDERSFNEDIVIPLKYQSGEIVIKEWSFLLGSGVEIYYKHEK